MDGEVDEEGYVKCSVFVECYLKQRDDPIMIPWTFKIHGHHLDDSGRGREVVNVATVALLQNVDTHEHRFVFEDSYGNRRIILLDELQFVSILSPEHT